MVQQYNETWGRTRLLSRNTIRRKRGRNTRKRRSLNRWKILSQGEMVINSPGINLGFKAEGGFWVSFPWRQRIKTGRFKVEPGKCVHWLWEMGLVRTGSHSVAQDHPFSLKFLCSKSGVVLLNTLFHKAGNKEDCIISSLWKITSVTLLWYLGNLRKPVCHQKDEQFLRIQVCPTRMHAPLLSVSGMPHIKSVDS